MLRRLRMPWLLPEAHFKTQVTDATKTGGGSYHTCTSPEPDAKRQCR